VNRPVSGRLSRNTTPLVLSTPAEEDRKRRRALAGTGGKAFLDSTAVVALDAAIRESVEELLPQATGLTDALGWTDYELNSDLGRRDGRVYEHLMSSAEANPLNRPVAARAKEVGQEEARLATGPDLADVGGSMDSSSSSSSSLALQTATTGLPKAITHRAGGMLLQLAKKHLIHGGLKREDVFFQYTALWWMMMNFAAWGILNVLYDGSALRPARRRSLR